MKEASKLNEILEKLNAMTDKLSEIDSRVSGVEIKLQKKNKLPSKSKTSKDVTQIHIFPFEENDEFVKIALIEDGQTNKEFYPVIELLKVDFEKLATLIIKSQTLSIQWKDFNMIDSVAKLENNKMILCS